MTNVSFLQYCYIVVNFSIQSIEVTNRDVVEDCFTETLSHWLKHSSPEYTKLVEALTSPSIGRVDIAEKVEAKWGKQN